MADSLDSSKRNEDYTIDYITVDDIPQVIELLKSHYFTNEPLSKSISLSDEERLILSKRNVSTISEHCSFKATRNNGELIGVILNEFLTKSTFDEKVKCDATLEKIYLDDYMMNYIKEQSNIFKSYPMYDRIMDNRLISVRSDCFGMGIGSKLLQRSIDYQREHRLGLFLIICSNHRSSKMSVKLGFERIYQIYCKDYMVNGVHPLLPEPPNDLVEAFIKKLN